MAIMENNGRKRKRLFENLITIEQFVEMTKGVYTRDTVYKWINRAGMPHKKLRGRVWLPLDEVEEWLQRSS
jgi:excisionase family DNA binding protein